MKTKINYRRVEEEEVQKETGRELWVVVQREVGCGAVVNILDRRPESKLVHHSHTLLIYFLSLKNLNWVSFMCQETVEKHIRSWISVYFERPQAQCLTSFLTLSRFAVYFVVQVIKQARNKDKITVCYSRTFPKPVT